MIRRPPRSTRTDTRVPYTTLFRSSGDVVHRCDAPTLSSGRDWQPEGRFLAALGQRRLLVTMNHIATSQPPFREPPETFLMGLDQRNLVLHPPTAVLTTLCTAPPPPLHPRPAPPHPPPPPAPRSPPPDPPRPHPP